MELHGPGKLGVLAISRVVQPIRLFGPNLTAASPPARSLHSCGPCAQPAKCAPSPIEYACSSFTKCSFTALLIAVAHGPLPPQYLKPNRFSNPPNFSTSGPTQQQHCTHTNPPSRDLQLEHQLGLVITFHCLFSHEIASLVQGATTTSL